MFNFGNYPTETSIQQHTHDCERFIVDIREISREYKRRLQDLLLDSNPDKGKMTFLYNETMNQIFFSISPDVDSFLLKLQSVSSIDYFMDKRDIMGRELLFQKLFADTGLKVFQHVSREVNPNGDHSEYILQSSNDEFLVILKRNLD